MGVSDSNIKLTFTQLCCIMIVVRAGDETAPCHVIVGLRSAQSYIPGFFILHKMPYSTPYLVH